MQKGRTGKMKQIPTQVFLNSNGAFIVFDKSEQQIARIQKLSFRKARKIILKEAGKDCKFTIGTFGFGFVDMPRECLESDTWVK